jgi:hypothetical protein
VIRFLGIVIMTSRENTELIDKCMADGYELGKPVGVVEGIKIGKHASGGYAAAWSASKKVVVQLKEEIAMLTEDCGQMLPDDVGVSLFEQLPSLTFVPIGDATASTACAVPPSESTS